ncbi:hypothetical protein Glove_276g38 [Diversispora epigaea]|uniref:Protein kinase domain-containing protein n=1 Tax=Diversispora epigaea TaxID=1348612 RepID=A0A397I2S3_9GLOM|nr:hypothetical protein Glove_276g38 [Diversispora epigaea]
MEKKSERDAVLKNQEQWKHRSFTKDPRTHIWIKELNYLKELVDIFEGFHKLDIIHSDLCPRNILAIDFNNYLYTQIFRLMGKNNKSCRFTIIAYEIIIGLLPDPDVTPDNDLALEICNGLRLKIPFHTPKLITQLMMHDAIFEELYGVE